MAEPNPTPTPTPQVKRTGKRTIKQIMVSPLQLGWLKAMGVDVPWIAANAPVSGVPVSDAPVSTQAVKAETPSEPASASAAPSIEHPMARSTARLAGPTPTKPMTAAPDLVPALELAALDLVQISQAVSACQRCGLCDTRRHAVPGQGVDKPKILIVGEAPGEQEDQQGQPFVGRSGQLLENMLKAIGHGRQTSVFITNVVKCRPPANRNPRDEEIAACAPYLARQIELLAPAAILAMGRFAAHALLKTDAPLQKLRTATHTLELVSHTLPVVVTYHPAYLLRRPIDKRLAWEDLKRLRQLVS